MLLILDFALLTAALYLLSFLPKHILSTFFPRLFRIWCNSFVRGLGVDLQLSQKNQHPLPKQYILIANHPSAFEDIGVPALFDVYSLAKIEVKDWPILGRISTAAGTLYVKRESRDSRKEAAEQIKAELAKGKNIALYPEGGCKGRRIFETFRYGAFDISMQTNIPIVPVFLHYEAQEAFEWIAPYTLVQKLWHFMTAPSKRVTYYVFDSLQPSDFQSKEEYMHKVHNMYLQWQDKYLK